MTPRTMTDRQPEPLVLGVDTGGTYTDAVLVSPSTGPVCWAKALTTPEDLSCGIMGAIDGLDGGLWRRVQRVCLSTTLATNAVVEGRGARVFLFLLGHDEDIEAGCLREIVQLALTGTPLGLPLITDVQPIGPRVVLRSKAIELGVSYSVECGADGVAIPWPGADSLRTILTMAAGLPVWVKAESLDPADPTLHEALSLGAAGLWLDGRIFAGAEPAALVAAFGTLVHGSVPEPA